MEPTDEGSGGKGKTLAIEVERIAYAAIGRHLRVMCFLCLLLLVLGFLIGHHVANQHTRELASDLEHRGDGLSEQIALLTGDVATLRHAAIDSERISAGLRAQVARNELAAKTLEERVESADSLRRSLVVEAIEQAEADRRGLLREFKPYVDQNQHLSAAVVSNALTRVIDAQRERLNRLIDAPTRAVCSNESASARPLVPVSESGPSPTISGGSASPMPEVPVAAATEIILFDAGPNGEGVAPAPPPPAEAPIKPAQAFASPTGLTPLPGGPTISLGPTVPPIPFIPAETASPAMSPAVGQVAIPAPSTASASTVEATPPGAAPAEAPEVRKSRSSLFFTPSRKLPSSAVPAIPIGSPVSAPAPEPAPLPPIRTAGPK